MSPQTDQSGTTSTSRLGRVVIMVIAISAIWLAFSGKLDLLHLSFGALSVAFTLAMCWHLLVPPADSQRSDSQRFRWSKAAGYPIWLTWQIMLANVHVARLILSPRLSLEPVVLRFSFPVDSAVAKATLGNSITLTPGTFTVRIHGDEFVVHSLDKASAASLYDGTMQRRVAEVFGWTLATAPTVTTEQGFEKIDDVDGEF